MHDLGSDEDLYNEYKSSAHVVLDRYGLSSLGMPDEFEQLAPQEVFKWAAQELASGGALSGGNGFFGAGLWWLCALGGG